MIESNNNLNVYRIGEVTNLQYKNFEFGERQSRPPFFKLNLRNRKNWQKREKNGEHQLSGEVHKKLYQTHELIPYEGHKYNIYPQPKMPEIDMYTHVLNWLEFYEKVLIGRCSREVSLVST
jgi:hypothetical protein